MNDSLKTDNEGSCFPLPYSKRRKWSIDSYPKWTQERKNLTNGQRYFDSSSHVISRNFSKMTKILENQKKLEKDENDKKRLIRGDIEDFIGNLEINREERNGFSKWDILPNELLLKIFHFLSPEDLTKVSQVCHSWKLVGQDPELWQKVEINIGQNKQSTPNSLIQLILDRHSKNLKSVVFKIDSAVESAEKVCQILSKFVDCSLKTLALISCARPVFLDVDQKSFTSALTVVFDRSNSLRSLTIDNTPVDDPSLKTLANNHSNTLQLLKMKSCPRVSPAGVLALADNCRRLRELSLSYALLSDDILLSLSSEQHARLTHLRIDVYTEPNSWQLQRISPMSWQALIKHSPNINLVLYFFIVDDETYDLFFHSYSPVTHLYFCEYVPKIVLNRVAFHCPRLRELVVNGTDGPSIDRELIEIGRQCQNLSSIGLSDCLVTCSVFVEFARICATRLSELFINEDCLLLDTNYDLQKVITVVSQLLLMDWAPEFTPLW